VRLSLSPETFQKLLEGGGERGGFQLVVDFHSGKFFNTEDTEVSQGKDKI